VFNYSTWILSSSHQSWARRSWTFRDFPWARSLSRFFINWVNEAWVVNIGVKYYKPGNVEIWPKNKIFNFLKNLKSTGKHFHPNYTFTQKLIFFYHAWNLGKIKKISGRRWGENMIFQENIYPYSLSIFLESLFPMYLFANHYIYSGNKFFSRI